MVQDNNEWQKHPDLYILDGTIVLLADTTLLRVYAGLLSRHSVVFEGLMESSQHVPDDTEDVYDGCPLVGLHDDPEDLAYFLKALLNLWGLPTSYAMASGILRLASKYMVQFLRQRAADHFRRIIPQSYNEIGNEESYSQVFGSKKVEWPHPFQLLTLFREHGLRSFLPWSYYSVCALGFEILLQGDTTHDGKKICLDPHDFHITLLGWKELCLMTHDVPNIAMNHNRYEDKCSSCRQKDPWARRETFTFETQAMRQWGKFKVLTYSAGHTLPPDLNPASFTSISDRPCQHCITAWLKRDRAERARIWSGLPAIFKLPDWTTLKKEYAI